VAHATATAAAALTKNRPFIPATDLAPNGFSSRFAELLESASISAGLPTVLRSNMIDEMGMEGGKNTRDAFRNITPDILAECFFCPACKYYVHVIRQLHDLLTAYSTPLKNGPTLENGKSANWRGYGKSRAEEAVLCVIAPTLSGDVAFLVDHGVGYTVEIFVDGEMSLGFSLTIETLHGCMLVRAHSFASGIWIANNTIGPFPANIINGGSKQF